MPNMFGFPLKKGHLPVILRQMAFFLTLLQLRASCTRMLLPNKVESLVSL